MIKKNWNCRIQKRPAHYTGLFYLSTDKLCNQTSYL